MKRMKKDTINIITEGDDKISKKLGFDKTDNHAQIFDWRAYIL